MLATGAVLAGALALMLAGCSNPVEDVVGNVNDEIEAVLEGSSEDVGADATDEADSSARTAQEELADPAPLEIADYGWFAAEGNMVDFSVVIENPNQYVAPSDVTLTVVGIDESGERFFSEDISLSDIAPESEYVLSYVTGDESDDAKLPADIAFSLSVADDGWHIDGSDASSYIVEGVEVAPSDMEGVEAAQGYVSSDSNEPEQVMVSLVLYDESERMLGGCFDIVELDGAESEQFRIYLIDAPAYDSYQIFVSPYVFD